MAALQRGGGSLLVTGDYSIEADRAQQHRLILMLLPLYILICIYASSLLVDTKSFTVIT
jgi:hypothetical protein